MPNDYITTMGKVTVTPAQWEQRRYEIAMKMMLYAVAESEDEDIHEVARKAIEYADALVQELKKTRR